jgi:hypothetical protein
MNADPHRRSLLLLPRLSFAATETVTFSPPPSFAADPLCATPVTINCVAILPMAQYLYLAETELFE